MWTVRTPGGWYQEEAGKAKEAYESDLHGETPDEGFVVQHCRVFVLFFRAGQAFFDCSGEIRMGYG